MQKKLTIAEMQAIAQERGGKCLSEIYVNADTHLVWQCAKGHQWKTASRKIKEGSWCPQCARDKQRLTIEEMQKIAEKHNGKCVSENYVNNQTPLLWQCEKRHQWKARPADIKQGQWCPHCANRVPLTLKEMQKIAEERGGKCLSERYINNSTKLLWQCAEEHQWKAVPSSIKQQKSWCPICAGNIPSSIEQMQHIAKERGGKCLTEIYLNSNTLILWECSEGHQWRNTPNHIKQGQWCPYCAINAPLTLEQMQKIAEEHGGKCLSKNYINSHTYMLWECNKEHQWEAPATSIKNQGSWCPYCAGKMQTIVDMQKIAHEKGGICLSETYLGANIHLLWQCAEGHQWKTMPSVIRNNGSWCPYCAGKAKLTLEEMQELAHKKGGKCLSDTYVNKDTHLLWQCTKGHQWKATPHKIKQGKWCPYCAGNAKLTIEEMQKIAQERNGKCLSKIYSGANVHLLWQCAVGHQWKAAPSDIKNLERWCPHCAGNARLTIEEMQRIAQEHGGECLSKTYINSKTPLLWQCAKGHQWETVPNIIRIGSWCPYCASGKYEQICRTYFESLFNNKFPRKKPLWLVNKESYRLELDGFSEKLGIAFEHQGIQHYKLTEHFQKSEFEFQKLQEHDEIKRQTCEKYGVLLIEIPQLFLITNPKDLPILVKQALEDANYPIPNKFNQVIVRKDGLVIDESDNENKHNEEKEELIYQLEIW